MPSDRDLRADSADVEQLRIEHVHRAAGHVASASAEHEPGGRAERDQRAPALWPGRIGRAVDQPIRLAAAEDIADNPGDSLLARRAPVGPTPAPLRRLVRGHDALLTGARCVLFELLD